MIHFRQRMLRVGLLILLFGLAPTHIAFADTLGQSVNFRVNSSYDISGAQNISATLRALGQNAYFYVDDRAWSALSSFQQEQMSVHLQQLANDFDSVIYPRETAFYGSESRPGVDSDPRMTVLVENLTSGVGGYYESVNQYPRSSAPESNEREMIVISFSSILGGGAHSFLAHEFQHLISFSQKEMPRGASDDTWLNEARSEYAITLAGYNQPYQGSTLQRRAQSFFANPSDSLTEWPNTSVDYAIVTLFAHYLTDRYGPEILAATIRTQNNGAGAIDEWLMGQGKSERFGNVFADWMVAAHVNNRNIDMRYGYATPGLDTIRVRPQTVTFLSESNPSSTTTTIEEWQPTWLQFIPPSMTGQATAINLQVQGQAGGSWWGGNAIAAYANGGYQVVPFTAVGGQGNISIPLSQNDSSLSHVVLAITQGSTVPVEDRQVAALSTTINASLGQATTTTIETPTPTPVPTSTALIKDGDLIRRPGQEEIYVVWGSYRRYLPQGVLRLYGFENRPVITVADDVFNRYTTSNYVRAVDGQKVYALWPDGTKHWLNITPAQWDASGRDWDAIFIVNNAEVNYYTADIDIVR